MNKELRNAKNLFVPSIALILLLGVWELGVSAFAIEKWLLPAPSLVAVSLWESRDLILNHSLQTMFETLVSIVIATILGVLFAMLMEWSVLLRNILKPFLIISQTIPFIVLAPLLIIWLGYGVLPKIVVVVLACFFPIAMSTFDGFRSVDVKKQKLLQSLGATKWQQFRYATFPSGLPHFFSGLRIAGAYAVGVAVVSEWLGAEKGLGIFLLRSAKSYQTEGVFAAIVVISLLSLALVGSIELVARRVIPWHFINKGGVL